MSERGFDWTLLIELYFKLTKSVQTLKIETYRLGDAQGGSGPGGFSLGGVSGAGSAGGSTTSGGDTNTFTIDAPMVTQDTTTPGQLPGSNMRWNTTPYSTTPPGQGTHAATRWTIYYNDVTPFDAATATQAWTSGNDTTNLTNIEFPPAVTSLSIDFDKVIIAVHIDTNGQESPPSDPVFVTAFSLGDTPDKPTVFQDTTTPGQAPGSNLRWSTTPYSTSPNNIGTHDYTIWTIYYNDVTPFDPATATLAWTSGNDTTNLTNIELPSSLLSLAPTPDKAIVAIHADASGVLSPPSDPVFVTKFTDGYTVDTPTIGEGFDILHFMSSPFSTTPANSGSHYASVWEIYADDGAGNPDLSSLVWDSGIDTVNLTDIQLSSGDLGIDQEFHIRVKHISTDNIESQSSVLLLFDTYGVLPTPEISTPADGSEYQGHSFVLKDYVNQDPTTYSDTPNVILYYTITDTVTGNVTNPFQSFSYNPNGIYPIDTSFRRPSNTENPVTVKIEINYEDQTTYDASPLLTLNLTNDPSLWGAYNATVSDNWSTINLNDNNGIWVNGGTISTYTGHNTTNKVIWKLYTGQDFSDPANLLFSGTIDNVSPVYSTNIGFIPYMLEDQISQLGSVQVVFPELSELWLVGVPVGQNNEELMTAEIAYSSLLTNRIFYKEPYIYENGTIPLNNYNSRIFNVGTAPLTNDVQHTKPYGFFRYEVGTGVTNGQITTVNNYFDFAVSNITGMSLNAFPMPYLPNDGSTISLQVKPVLNEPFATYWTTRTYPPIEATISGAPAELNYTTSDFIVNTETDNPTSFNIALTVSYVNLSYNIWYGYVIYENYGTANERPIAGASRWGRHKSRFIAQCLDRVTQDAGLQVGTTYKIKIFGAVFNSSCSPVFEFDYTPDRLVPPDTSPVVLTKDTTMNSLASLEAPGMHDIFLNYDSTTNTAIKATTKDDGTNTYAILFKTDMTNNTLTAWKTSTIDYGTFGSKYPYGMHGYYDAPRNKYFILGHPGSAADASSAIYASDVVYDVATDTWSTGPLFASGRTDLFGAATVTDPEGLGFYILGGRRISGDNDFSTAFTRVRWDNTTNQYVVEDKAPLPQATREATCSIYNGNIYYMYGQYNNQGTVYKYDHITNTWSVYLNQTDGEYYQYQGRRIIQFDGGWVGKFSIHNGGDTLHKYNLANNKVSFVEKNASGPWLGLIYASNNHADCYERDTFSINSNISYRRYNF